MTAIHKILAPTNFTEACRQATRFAIHLGSAWDADVYVVHVLEQLSGITGFESAFVMEDTRRSQRHSATRELESIASLQTSSRLHTVLLDGDPASAIVKYAHDENVGLIVMPTRGYGVFRRLLLGSVTAKVLHDADCPVWTGVHPEAMTADGVVAISRIACAIDLGPQTRTALRWASDLAKFWGAELHLVHVLLTVPDEAWKDRLSEMAREQVASLLEDLGISAELHLDFGHIPGGVTDAVKRVSPDLLVIGRGHVGPSLRLRGNAYAIIRDCACPVVSV